MLVISLSCAGSKDKHLARGEEYLQKRKFHEALMEFRTAAEIDRNSAEAQWGLARAYESLGQFGETIESLRKTEELAPDNLSARVKLGNYYLLVQPPMISETEKIVAQVLAKDPNNIEGQILSASVLAVQQRPETEIVRVLDGAIAIKPDRTESYISKARYYQTIKKAADAEEAIKKGIAANPNGPVGYVEYGRFLDYSGRTADAETQFRKALETDSKNIDAREAFADFLTSGRQYDKAEDIYRELVQLQENSPESRIAFAGFYARIGRDAEAIRILKEIIAAQSEYVRARYRLAELYLKRRENNQVSEQVAELLKINDTDYEALILRSRLALAENRSDDAVKDLETILKALPSHKDALFLMVEARLELGQTEQARAFIGDLEKYHPNYLRTRMLKIQAAYFDGDAAGAFRLADELFQATSRTVATGSAMTGEISELRFRALSARGLASLELGKLAEAKADLTEVQKNAPRSTAALINLAKVSNAERKHDESLGFYERALTIDGNNFDALSGAVGVLSRQKRFVDAHAKVDGSLAANGANQGTAAALQYLKADIFLAENNVEAAEAALKRSIELDEGYLPAYSSYASLLVDRNQIAEAIVEFRRVVEKKASPAIYTLIGMLEDARENYAEAEKNYRTALKLEPESPIAANNLAWVIADRGQGNLDEALMLSQTVVNKYSKTAGYYDTLGWVYFKKGLYSPAVEQFRRAVAIDESDAKRLGTELNPVYRVRLATALASAGDKFAARREAEASLQNANSLSPKDAQDVRSLLATL